MTVSPTARRGRVQQPDARGRLHVPVQLFRPPGGGGPVPRPAHRNWAATGRASDGTPPPPCLTLAFHCLYTAFPWPSTAFPLPFLGPATALTLPFLDLPLPLHCLSTALPLPARWGSGTRMHWSCSWPPHTKPPARRGTGPPPPPPPREAPPGCEHGL